jgi:hypothetical protein
MDAMLFADSEAGVFESMAASWSMPHRRAPRRNNATALDQLIAFTGRNPAMTSPNNPSAAFVNHPCCRLVGCDGQSRALNDV